jgi:hypothetical protein
VPSTAETSARAARVRSARPASVTVSRTATPAISAPAFPAALVPGTMWGRRADIGMHSRLSGASSQHASPAPLVRAVRRKPSGYTDGPTGPKPRPSLAPQGISHLVPLPGRHRHPGRLHHPDPEPLRPRPRHPVRTRGTSTYISASSAPASTRATCPSRSAAPSSDLAPGDVLTACCSSPGTPASFRPRGTRYLAGNPLRAGRPARACLRRTARQPPPAASGHRYPDPARRPTVPASPGTISASPQHSTPTAARESPRADTAGVPARLRRRGW